MANSKFPGLNQKYVQEIEQRTATLPAGRKELMQQQMYSDFYSQQKREEEQQERLAMKNEIAKKQLEANSGTDTGANLQLKKGNLADAIRNFYKLTISQGDDDSLVSKFTKGIKNGDKMYIDYLNGDNNDIMIQTGLLGDTAKNLYNSPYNNLNKGNNLANGNNQNIPESAKTLIENKPGNSNAVMYSSSVFDDDQYSKYYLDNVEDDYKPFVEAAKSQGYSDGEIASIIDKRKTYEDFTDRGFGNKAEELNVGVFQGFANFLGNAYNNLLGENPYVGIAPKLNMNDIQFADDLLGSTNNYGDLRAESGWTKTGEIGGDLIANTALMYLLPGMGGTAKMESIAESALNGTKSVLKNIGQRFLYGATEGAEFGALNTLGQENADLDKLESNMELGAAFGGGFGLGGAGVNSYKYRNILNTLRKEGDKEGTIKTLLDMYNRGIKPTSQGVKTNTQLQQYNDDAMGAVESIIKNKNALKYIDANGEETFGHLPRSLDEFSQAIKQTKQSIYDRYAAIAKDAGQTTNVDTSDIVTALKKQLKDKEWRAGQSEATIGKMEKWIKDLEELNNTMSVEGAQAKVQELNQKIQAFLKSQNPNDVSPNAVDGLVLNGLKKGIDDAIDKAGLDSEEYIQLRNMYRQLKSIESDVNHRAVVYGRQNPQSLVDSMSDLQTIDAIADIFSNPIGGTVKLVKTKAFKLAAKDRNNSNKIVENMFKDADDTISKTNTLKSQTQIANERTQQQQYNIRKSRQQRLEEANARVQERERLKQAVLEKQQQQQQEYQNYLNLMEKLKKTENPGLGYNEGFNGEPTTTIIGTPEGTNIRSGRGEITEAPTKNVNYVKQQLKEMGVSDEQIESVIKEIEAKNAKQEGLFGAVDKGIESEGLNPEILSTKDLRKMEDLDNVTSALKREDKADYISNRIAEDLGVNKFGDSANMDKYANIVGDVENLIADFEYGGNDAAKIRAEHLFPGETAESIINKYTQAYEKDLKAYKDLVKKYEGYEKGNVKLSGKINSKASEPIKLYRGEGGGDKKYNFTAYTPDESIAKSYGSKVSEKTITPKKLADFSNPSDELVKIVKDTRGKNFDWVDEKYIRDLFNKKEFSLGTNAYDLFENNELLKALKDKGYDFVRFNDFSKDFKPHDSYFNISDAIK